MKSKSKPRIKGSLIYLGFNAQVVALDRQTGRAVWTWAAKRGNGFVAILVEGKRLFASVSGYTYCLNAQTGKQLWYNPLSGFGTGIPCLASAHGTSSMPAAGAQTEQDAAAATAANPQPAVTS